VLGGGTPFFPAVAERIDLELVETRTFAAASRSPATGACDRRSGRVLVRRRSRRARRVPDDGRHHPIPQLSGGT
jgi:hypothetical protein